jgi:hypothetical protein
MWIHWKPFLQIRIVRQHLIYVLGKTAAFFDRETENTLMVRSMMCSQRQPVSSTGVASQ